MSVSLMGKILILLSAMAAGWLHFHKNRSGRELVCGGIVLALFALFANVVSGAVPTLRDSVTLTALGEKNEAAWADEVFLLGYTIDGREYTCGENINTGGGNWFWYGDSYCWRNETDPRQPEGTTRSVTVGIPVGRDRTLNFDGNAYRGLVEISFAGDTWTVDTYLKDYGTVPAFIGGSAVSVLIWNQMRVLLVYAVIFSGLCGAAWTVLKRRVERDPAETEHGSGTVLYGGVALLALILMLEYADSQSLWNDELQRLTECKASFSYGLNELLNMKDASPPLFFLIGHIWCRIAPFGENWLLLICIIPAACSAFLMGICGEKLCGRPFGILACSLMAFSQTVWGYAAFEFAGYALMIFFSALCLTAHVMKGQTQESLRWLVVYSVALLGLAMSHYFGMLACAAFFLADLVLFVKKRCTLRSAVAYILPGVAKLLWLAAVWKTSLHSRSLEEIADWYGTPTFTSGMGILQFVSGNIELLFCLLMQGLAIVIVLLFSKREKDKWSEKEFYFHFFAAALIGMPALLYIYGNYVNQQSSMWMGKYFLFLTPFAVLFIAEAVFLTIELICPASARASAHRKKRFLQTAVSVFLCLYVFRNCIAFAPVCGPDQPFRQAADWLYSQGNVVFNEDTLIVVTSYADIWNEYYVSRLGRRAELNVVQQLEVSRKMLEKYNNVYLLYIHAGVDPELQAQLDEIYNLQEDISTYQLRYYVRKQPV